MFAAAGHPEIKHDSVAWCAAFVGACLKANKLKTTGSLMALSYAKWGLPLSQPVYGCVAAKTRTGGGHVGFVVGASRTQIFLLAGNQGNQVSIAAVPRGDFKSYRWPSDYPLPSPLPDLPSAMSGVRTGLSES